MLTAPSQTEREQGSVLLAVLVLMIISLLAAAMFTESFQRLSGSRDRADAAAADSAAELAVNEAFARIDAGETIAFRGSGDVGESSYSYEATPVGSSSWQIDGQATNGDVERTLSGLATREPRYGYTLFAEDRLSIDRNRGRVAGRVGTNGTMEITGPSPGDAQELYRPDGACSGCSDPVTLDGPRTVVPVTRPVGPTQRCPVGGLFTTFVDGRGGVPFICDDRGAPVSFAGPVLVVNPPAIVYVGPSVSLSMDGALVNPFGRAADFRFYVAGDSSRSGSALSATGTTITALIDAPGRSLRTDDTTLTGSLTIGELEVPRLGRLQIVSDTSLESLADQAWRLEDLH